MGTTGKRIGIYALIYSLYFFAPTISAMSPAVAEIGLAYPTVDTATIGYVVTITAILQAITALAAGAVAGRLKNLKPLVAFAALLYVVSGCFPFLLQDGQGFVALLVSRALFGVSTGIIMPLSNTLVMLNFPDEQQKAGVVGVGNVMLSVGTVVTNLIGGYLCLISWQATFLVYALGLVTLVLALTVRKQALANPATDENPNRDAALKESNAPSQEPSRNAMPAAAFGYLLLFLVVIIATQPMVVYNAQYIASAQLGDSVTAGYTTAAFSVGGAIASLGFRRFYAAFGKWILPVAFAIATASAVLGYLGSSPVQGSIVFYAVGILLAGFALLLATCFTPIMVSSIVPPRLLTAAMGMVSFVTAAGTFLTTPCTQIAAALTGTDGIRAVLLAVAILTALAFIAISAAISAKSRREAQ